MISKKKKKVFTQIETVFLSKFKGDLQEKKKVFTQIETVFLSKFKGDLQNEKKKSFTQIETVFLSKFKRDLKKKRSSLKLRQFLCPNNGDLLKKKKKQGLHSC